MRLQFEMSEDRVKELDGLVDRLELKTRVNLINSALTLFEWAVREREAGRIIASVDETEDKYKEIEMPGFPSIQDYTRTVKIASISHNIANKPDESIIWEEKRKVKKGEGDSIIYITDQTGKVRKIFSAELDPEFFEEIEESNVSEEETGE